MVVKRKGGYRMKRWICLVLAGVLALLPLGCNKRNLGHNIDSSATNTTPASHEILLSVLHNSEPFINEQNETVFLQDYKLGDYKNVAVIPQKYAFIDFNENGTKELIVYVSPDYGAYMIFRYDDQNIYGYSFDSRALIDLKTDGSFMQSEGAGINPYAKISFGKSGYTITEEALVNTAEGLYKINGKVVARESIEEFTDKWHKKSAIGWTNVN